MKMNFRYHDEGPIEGNIESVTLVLSWDEYCFLADGAHIFQAVMNCSYWDDSHLDTEARDALIKRFDDLNGDGEDSNPIDAQSRMICPACYTELIFVLDDGRSCWHCPSCADPDWIPEEERNG